MFEDFESADFKVSNDNLFKTPNQLKKDRFTYYMKWSGDSRVGQLISEDEAFKRFLHTKWSKFVEGIKIRLDHEGLLSQVEESTDIKSAFNQVGKSIWLLQKLAFAYEPASAEIFHVPAGSTFHEDYMMEPLDMAAQNISDASPDRRVALTTTPGFTLRNSIIQAQVCCTDFFSVMNAEE
ncbi:hypothetical protein KP509_10G060400 [Ceratopteris richardii]|uniref:GIL1/IRKI C-terminal domain-containing protein n=1 Tax=Ceratopteris richardii TaxID=49495 RepID=A0A8T2U2J2_CERRI|nr:hypothetical protein KP509_10G060400 [Ceratopteris richardii]KAH7427795.1 hypothetical protein KP509_10G060400 [Ceratopteris richardii]